MIHRMQSRSKSLTKKVHSGFSQTLMPVPSEHWQKKKQKKKTTKKQKKNKKTAKLLIALVTSVPWDVSVG